MQGSTGTARRGAHLDLGLDAGAAAQRRGVNVAGDHGCKGRRVWQGRGGFLGWGAHIQGTAARGQGGAAHCAHPSLAGRLLTSQASALGIDADQCRLG